MASFSAKDQLQKQQISVQVEETEKDDNLTGHMAKVLLVFVEVEDRDRENRNLEAVEEHEGKHQKGDVAEDGQNFEQLRHDHEEGEHREINKAGHGVLDEQKNDQHD